MTDDDRSFTGFNEAAQSTLFALGEAISTLNRRIDEADASGLEARGSTHRETDYGHRPGIAHSARRGAAEARRCRPSYKDQLKCPLCQR
jgi:hypothetical protein